MCGVRLLQMWTKVSDAIISNYLDALSSQKRKKLDQELDDRMEAMKFGFNMT